MDGLPGLVSEVDTINEVGVQLVKHIGYVDRYLLEISAVVGNSWE